jgi:hypothetical protein
VTASVSSRATTSAEAGFVRLGVTATAAELCGDPVGVGDPVPVADGAVDPEELGVVLVVLVPLLPPPQANTKKMAKRGRRNGT